MLKDDTLRCATARYQVTKGTPELAVFGAHNTTKQHEENSTRTKKKYTQFFHVSVCACVCASLTWSKFVNMSPRLLLCQLPSTKKGKGASLGM